MDFTHALRFGANFFLMAAFNSSKEFTSDISSVFRRVDDDGGGGYMTSMCFGMIYPVA